MTAEALREKIRVRDTFIGRINYRLETERLDADGFITECICYRKNKSEDLDRYYRQAEASGKKKVSEVFSEDDLRGMFADAETLEAERNLTERGFTVKYFGYSHVWGLIGCDLVISWQ